MSKTQDHPKQLRDAARRKPKFPVGTVAYYGPDDKNITKIAAGVFTSRQAEPIMRKWFGPHVATDPQVAAEIGRFFQEHHVQEVAMTDGIVGCPHEEGIDYPIGESCPHCPFWQDRD